MRLEGAAGFYGITPNIALTNQVRRMFKNNPKAKVEIINTGVLATGNKWAGEGSYSGVASKYFGKEIQIVMVRLL